MNIRLKQFQAECLAIDDEYADKFDCELTAEEHIKLSNDMQKEKNYAAISAANDMGFFVGDRVRDGDGESYFIDSIYSVKAHRNAGENISVRCEFSNNKGKSKIMRYLPIASIKKDYL